MRQKLIYGVISALFLPAWAATPAYADETTDLLVKQVQELQRTVQDLKQELQTVKAPSAKAGESATQPAGDAGAAVATLDDVNGLRSDLENFKYQYGREREYSTAQTSRPVNVSGFVQARYQHDSQDNANNLLPNNGNNNSRNDSFNNGSAAIQFSGLLYKDYENGRNLAYTLRLAANPSAASGVNAAGSNSTVNLQFANLTYNFRPTLSPEDPRLTLTFGQQLVPFGLETAATDELKPTINTAQFAAITPNIDIGAVVRGELGVNYDYGYSYRAPTLVYQLGVLNGSGPNTSDVNQDKDYFGRVVYTLPSDYNSWLRQLAIGASYYKGTQNLYANNTLNTGTLLGDGKKDRLGFDVYYNHDPFGITYEYIQGKDERTYGATRASEREVESRGQVLTAYYNIGPQFLYANSALGTPSVSIGRFDDWWPKSYQLFARYDKWEPDVNDDTKALPAAQRLYDQDIATLGLNVFFAQTTKFQLNYNIIDSEQPGRKNNNQILAQFQYTF